MKRLLLILCLCVTTVLAQSDSYTLKFYDTTKLNPKVLNKDFTVKIGDSTKALFDPCFAVTAWGGECAMRLDLSTAAHPMDGATKVVSSFNGKSRVTLSTTSVDHDMYAKSDGFEWEIILNKKPSTNVFTYDIETQNLLFFYRSDPLDSFNLPDSVDGSYVAKHPTKRDNYNYVSPSDTTYENHGTGGAFTIWTPTAWNATDTVRCSLHVDLAAGKLSVIVPQKFLDSAVYPVVIGPKFGFETQGGTEQYIDDVILGWRGAPSSDGTLDSITVYLKVLTEVCSAHVAAYKHSDGALIDSSVGRDIAIGEGWETFDLLLDGQVTSATVYRLLTQGEDASGTIFMVYDATGDGQHKFVTYGVWPDPLTGMTNDNWDISIYAWYTVEAAAGGSVMIIGTE